MSIFQIRNKSGSLFFMFFITSFLSLFIATQTVGAPPSVLSPSTSPSALSISIFLTDVAQVSSGPLHACAVLNNGRVRCWGSNNVGEFGIDSGAYPDPTTDTDLTAAKAVTGITTATQVATGLGFSCALLSDGQVKCWGTTSSYYGGLGDGSTSSYTPVTVSGITKATSVSAAFTHACASLSSGEVQCWGWNLYGQLGDGTTTAAAIPVTVSGISDAISVAVGYYHSCALLSSGEINCWGKNTSGNLGDGTTTNSSIPVTVSGISTAESISSNCAILSSGEINCWGQNSDGQLGNGTTTASSTPVAVSGVTNAESVTSGSIFTCATLITGKVQCWGSNEYGQLGDGSSVTNSSTPVSVTGITDAVDIDGGSAACAVLSSGSVKCWGYNYYGNLGNGKTTDSSTPVPVRN